MMFQRESEACENIWGLASFHLCQLYLSVFTLLEIILEKILNLLIYLKIINSLYVNIKNILLK